LRSARHERVDRARRVDRHARRGDRRAAARPIRAQARPRATAGAIGAVSAWSILVAAGIFSGDTQFWLIVAGAIASSTLALGAAVEDVVRERDAKRRLVGVPSAQAA
jgi:outer membrane lipoprotein SlyB